MDHTKFHSEIQIQFDLYLNLIENKIKNFILKLNIKNNIQIFLIIYMHQQKIFKIFIIQINTIQSIFFRYKNHDTQTTKFIAIQ